MTYKILKKIIDKFTSLILLVLLSPFLFIICFIIYLVDGRPILYSQERIAKNGIFNIFKFKTMTNKYFGFQVTQNNDQRITKLGGILRKFKLDELPQLLNILKGDMSFIGPRPESVYFLKYYPKDYLSIFKAVKPGLFDSYTIQNINESDWLALYKNPEEVYIKKLIPKKYEAAKNYKKNISLIYDLNCIFNYTKLILKKFFIHL